jgi:hypothetical protein
MISSSKGCRRWLRPPLPLHQVAVVVSSLLFKYRRSNLSKSLTAISKYFWTLISLIKGSRQ